MTALPGFRLGLLLLLCGFFSACSSFDARWKAAATGTTAERWEGRWTSEHHKAPGGSPMGGRLLAITEPAAEHQLTAHFHANWLALFASDYTMTLQPKAAGPRRGEGREFSGAHELSKMFGGTYRYTARIAGDEFTARYDSSYDRGTFSLRRVQMSKDCFPARARH